MNAQEANSMVLNQARQELKINELGSQINHLTLIVEALEDYIVGKMTVSEKKEWRKRQNEQS